MNNVYKKEWGKMIKLAIDAMSGDLGAPIAVEACKEFIKENKDVKLFVTGREEALAELKGIENIEIVPAKDIMGMAEGIMAVRRKKDSSMVKAVILTNDDQADAVVSCGSTGAFYTAAMLFMKRIEGVEKCALLASIPTINGKGVIMLDVGANVENSPEQLTQFAIMGSCYVTSVKNIQYPRVALLNIGTEDKKGDEVHKETYKLLNELEKIQFVGNIEGREILSGEADVIVTDGFSGNIALKTMEGTAKTFMTLLSQSLKGSTSGKIGGLFAKKSLYSMKDKFDYKSVGGAFMAGFEKPVIKAHGASDATAFLNAMKLAKSMVKDKSIEKMKAGLLKDETN